MDIPYLSLQRVNNLHIDEIRQAVDRVVQSGWYLKGEATRRFETNYARYLGVDHCVACGNGLDALTLIFRAYKEMGLLTDGDEVIVPANTYIASILSITENHLRPVLVEPDSNTLQIDDRLVEQAITPRTRALLLVHLYGRCAFTPTIGRFCKEHALLLVEDNAQAHGCCFIGDGRQQMTGGLGDAAAHSFYPGKNLGALGDAGAVTTCDARLAEVVTALGNYGSSRKYVFPYKGLNSRMDEVQAAVLDVKLRYLDSENNRRREIADRYYRQIDNPWVTLPGIKAWADREHATAEGELPAALTDNVFHIFPVLSTERDALQQWLAQCGVGTMIHYPIPPHRQQCYSEWADYSLPVTENIHRQELSLPCNQTMTDSEADYVARCVNEFSPAR